MKRTIIGTHPQCMEVIRKSERMNKSKRNPNSGYSHYEMEPFQISDKEHRALWDNPDTHYSNVFKTCPTTSRRLVVLSLYR